MKQILHSLQHGLRRFVGLLPVRAPLIRSASVDEIRAGRPNRLAAILALAGVIFALAVRIPFVAFGIGYVAVVLLSLTSSRVWHTHVATIVSTALIVLKVVIAPSGVAFLVVSANAVLSLFAIWTTALLSLSIATRERNEAAVRAQATAAAQESETLRAALQRAATAEAEVRPALERLHLATEAAGIGVWDRDFMVGTFQGDDNFWRLMNQPPDTPPDELFQRSVHADDQLMIRERIHALLKNPSMTGGVLSLRHRVVLEDQSIRHVQRHAKIFYDATGKLLRILGVVWDVTDEVTRTDRERELAERLGVATQAAGISAWEFDLKSRRFVWDTNRPKAFGLDHVPIDDLMPNLFAITHVDDRALMLNDMEQALAHGETNYSYRFRTARDNHPIRHMQSFAKIVVGTQGEPVRIMGATWDITNEVHTTEMMQRQAEQERALLDRFSIATQAAGIASWQLDFEPPRIVWHDNFSTERYGENNDDILGTITRLQHPDDSSVFHDALVTALKTKSDIMSYRYRIREADGSWRHTQNHARILFDAQRKPIGALGVTWSTTKEVQAAEQLRQIELRFERAINGTQDGLWEIDVRTGNVWASPRYATLLRIEMESQMTSIDAVMERVHPDDVAMSHAASDAHYRHNTPYDIELRMRTGDGEYRWFRARAAAERDADGTPLRLSGSLQDIAEARAAREDLLRATDEAQTANKAKSAFLANVSHEIRTPMNGILGMTSLLIDTELDRTQRDYAETIRASADSLLTIINDILDFSKIEAGKLDIESIELDLRANVDDVGAMMALQASAKRLELVINIHPNVPTHVLGDPQRIRQCLINLIGNAIKFTRSGEVVVEVSAAGGSDDRSNGHVATRFEVRDTGIGIAQESLGQLFQPFTQADTSTTRHFGGTGLGLSIVRRLVEMMGGQVGASSQVGQGSSFWFTLPMTSVASTLTAPAVSHLGREQRILVVDDNHTNRRVLLGQLEHAGYAVDAAANGADALTLLRHALAEHRPFDLGLIDLQMPEMDGAMLGERINADPQLSRARLIMLTSMDRHGDMRQFAALGFAGYLCKPVRTSDLFDCIERVLSRDAHEWHLQHQPLVTRGTLLANGAKQGFSAQVLLIEDNLVNQKVAQQFLQRLGCTVTIADNGDMGVKCYQQSVEQKRFFDIVLMDLQMPVMDGFTATRHIRDFEGWRERIPIVALTANAMTGQMERCLAAGMDDFLTKPLDVNRLREVLDKFGFAVDKDAQAHNSTADSTVSDAVAEAMLSDDPSSVTSIEPVDLVHLDSITDGDAEFARDLIATFSSSGQQVIAELAAAITQDDRAATARAAHKLKGAAANLHAAPLNKVCAQIEANVNALPVAALQSHLQQIENEFKRACDYLSATRYRDLKQGAA